MLQSLAPEEILPGLWRLVLPMAPGDERTVNAYLIRDREGYLLVDCGFEGERSWAVFTGQLRALSIAVDAIRLIVITHAHPDHYGLAARIREEAGARIWLHAAEDEFARQRFAERDAYRDLLTAWLLRYGFPEAEAAEMAVAWDAMTECAAPIPDRLLSGGEELAAGAYRFEIIWTPGHSPGHVCLYEPRHRVLICGDHVLAHSSPNVSLQPTSADNPMAEYLNSLRQLAAMDVGVVLPGHGEPFHAVTERVQEVLRHQLARQERLLALLTDRPQTAYELASQVWAESRRWSWQQLGRRRRNAVGTVAAHLELLATEGAITRSEDRCVRFARQR